MSFWDFIGGLAAWSMLRKRLSNKQSNVRQTPAWNCGRGYDAAYDEHIDRLNREISESKRRIAEYSRMAGGSVSPDLDDCDLDELQCRMDELESRLDSCDVMSEDYDTIQDEIDMLQDRIDEIENREFDNCMDWGHHDWYADTNRLYDDDLSDDPACDDADHFYDDHLYDDYDR